VGTAYTGTTLAATGGTPPYTWSLSSGTTLPGGLSMSSAGAIFRHADGLRKLHDPGHRYRFFSSRVLLPPVFIVRIAAAALVVTTMFAARGDPGDRLHSHHPGRDRRDSAVHLVGGFGHGACPVASRSVPPAWCPARRLPPVLFPVTLQVADFGAGGLPHGPIALRWPPRRCPLSITTQSPLPGGTVGVAYTLTFAATGGTSPYNWYLSSGAFRPVSR